MAGCPEDVAPFDGDAIGERYARGGLWVRLDDPSAWEDVPDPDNPAPLDL
jgi:hypothetical protein